MLPFGATLASSEGESEAAKSEAPGSGPDGTEGAGTEGTGTEGAGTEGAGTEGAGPEGAGSAPPDEDPSGSGGAQAENPGDAAPDAGLDAGDKNAGEESPGLSQAPEASGGMLMSMDLGPLNAPPISIDLSVVGPGSSGTGWSYSGADAANAGTNSKIIFNNAASGNEYVIVRSNPVNAAFARHIEINSDVNGVTVIYDGPNIKIYKNGLNPYVQFNSDVTVKGGSNNTVIFNDVVNLSNNTFTIDSGATGTTVQYNRLSHQDTYNLTGYSTFKFTDNGAGTSLTYDGGFIRTLTITSGGANVDLTFKGGFKSDSLTFTSNGAGAKLTFGGVNINITVIDHNNISSGNKMKMYTGGVNTFAQTHNSYFRLTQAAGANLEMYLSGSTTVGTGTSGTHNAALYGYGYITVPQSSSLTIDSADNPGSDQGLFAIARNDSTAAVIGSVGSTNGPITINGGTTKAVMTYATANNATGAAIGSGAGGNGVGTVVINGGKVIAKAVNGAGIGSGEGSGSVGKVTINGGAVVDARNTTASDVQNGGGGAAIGGGRYSSGNVIIEDGAIVTAKSSNGAAIGGGQNGTYGDFNMAVGKVTINGGKIDAESVYNGVGAAIGGGGSSGAGGPKQGIPNVDINGGELNLKSHYGANIGRGGSTANPDTNTVLNNAGYINIGKARIFGEFSYGSCVGSGQNALMWPTLSISADADIMAFGQAIMNSPGIDPGAASGLVVNPTGAYFVNGNFYKATTATDGLFIVYDKANPGIPVRIEEIPFAAHLFAYTTGTTTQRIDHIFMGSYSGGARQVVRFRDKSPDILSVLNTLWYYNNNYNSTPATHPNPPDSAYNAWYRAQQVDFGAAGIYQLQVPVREYYVDTFGNPLPASLIPSALVTGKDYSLSLVELGQNFTKAVPNIKGYDAEGYKWYYNPPQGSAQGPPDNSGSDFIAGNPTNCTPQFRLAGAPPDAIYFVYSKRPTHADFAVSKTVSGVAADRTKAYNFTVTLYAYDENNNSWSAYTQGKTINYEGDIIPGSGATAPPNGVLTLGAGGTATFSLMHGQKIIFKGLPVDDKIEIVETPYSNYIPSYIDSKTPGTKIKNYIFAPDVVGLVNGRTIAFDNERPYAPLTGIGGTLLYVVLPLMAGLILLASLWAPRFLRRKLWTK